MICGSIVETMENSILIPIMLLVISHVIAGIWWASRVSAQLDFMRKNLSEITTEIKTLRQLYVSREEFAGRVALSNQEHVAIWKSIEELKEKA